MPGSGIRLDNVKTLIGMTGSRAIHASLLQKQPSRMEFKNIHAKMGKVDDEYSSAVTSAAMVKSMVQVLNCLDNSVTS